MPLGSHRSLPWRSSRDEAAGASSPPASMSPACAQARATERRVGRRTAQILGETGDVFQPFADLLRVEIDRETPMQMTSSARSGAQVVDFACQETGNGNAQDVDFAQTARNTVLTRKMEFCSFDAGSAAGSPVAMLPCIVESGATLRRPPRPVAPLRALTPLTPAIALSLPSSPSGASPSSPFAGAGRHPAVRLAAVAVPFARCPPSCHQAAASARWT